MLPALFASLLLSTSAAFVPVPEKTPPLTGAPPIVQAISSVDADKGLVLVEQTRTERVPVQVAESINVNGQTITRVRTEYKEVPTVTKQAFPVKDGKVQTADGKKLTAAEALKRLKAGTPIVISADGNPVSPGYLAIFQPDTIVLIREASAAATPAAGPASPPVVPAVPAVPPPAKKK